MYCAPMYLNILEISWHFPAAPYRPSALNKTKDKTKTKTKTRDLWSRKYDAIINIVISGFADLEREFISGLFGSE